jgi:signal transduction histidine kinase
MVEEGPPRPLIQRLGPRHWRNLDILLAVGLFGVSVGVTATIAGLSPGGTGWNVARYVAIAEVCLPLPARRRYPLGTMAVLTLGAAFVVALGAEEVNVVAVAFAMYTVACVTPRRISLGALGVTVAAIVAGAAIGGGPHMAANLVGIPTLTALGWVAGENTRARQAYAAGVAEQAVERERQREATLLQTASDERLRIARELHDVVAHAMSVIAVRSGVARVVMDSQPDEARQALGIIESTSRRALQEMRLIVGVLRMGEETDDSARAPAPGLAEMASLLKQTEEAGVPVDVQVEGDERRLPPGVDLSAYRIVQEALTNVVRHAGPTHVAVRMTYQPDQLTIEVTDDGPRGSLPRPVVADGSPGHGLVGMRERVGLFGGELQAGRLERGFRVWARLPTDERSA